MNKFIVSSSPHIRSGETTQRIMLDVIIALVPSAVAGTVIFGWRSLAVIAACVLAAVLTEFLFNLATRREQTVGDLSAVVTGLILALNLHANVPIWQCVIGSVFAIAVVKCLFGGLGCNFANPAITARILMMVSFTSTVGGYANPVLSPDTVSSATPLSQLAAGGEVPSALTLFLGNYGGAIGETCTLAILVGFLYLVFRKVIRWEIPTVFVLTVYLLSLIVTNDPVGALLYVLSGGVFFGAVFMATDYVTSPITNMGRVIFAFGCGLLTVLIRFFGTYPEGVSFAILIMNILSPYIERWTQKRPLGGKKNEKA